MDKLNKGIFSKKDKISLGVIRKEFVDFFNTHGLNGILKYDTPIIFWAERIEHTETHKNDFVSDTIYELCFEEIPNIINEPDYISIHPKKNSVSFIRNYSSNHVNVAIRVTVSGGLAYRTMYPLIDAMLTHYMDTDHAWRVKYKDDGSPVIIDNVQDS